MAQYRALLSGVGFFARNWLKRTDLMVCTAVESACSEKWVNCR